MSKYNNIKYIQKLKYCPRLPVLLHKNMRVTKQDTHICDLTTWTISPRTIERYQQHSARPSQTRLTFLYMYTKYNSQIPQFQYTAEHLSYPSWRSDQEPPRERACAQGISPKDTQARLRDSANDCRLYKRARGGNRIGRCRRRISCRRRELRRRR